MNLNYILEKKHIFKKRRIYFFRRTYKFRIGTSALLSLKPQRFELIYMRGFKRIMRRKYIRSRMRFKKKKFWFFVKPNCILSGKSTNSRMGAGVGSLVRLTVNIPAYYNFMEFRGYSKPWLSKLPSYLRYRYPIKFLPIFKSRRWY